MAGGRWDASALGALTRSLGDIDIGSMGDGALVDLTARLEVLLNSATAISALALDEQARRAAATPTPPRPRSTVGETARLTGSSRRALRERARAGAALRTVPGAEPLARAGRLSPDHLAGLAACAGHDPDRASADAVLLLSEADVLDADAFLAAARHWRHHLGRAPHDATDAAAGHLAAAPDAT
jgi:hypothetical protein